MRTVAANVPCDRNGRQRRDADSFCDVTGIYQVSSRKLLSLLRQLFLLTFPIIPRLSLSLSP